MSHKRHSVQKDYTVRELSPKLESGKKGVAVLCPFCALPHTLLPGQESPCGTMLKVMAVQVVMTSHASKHKKIPCLKCKQIGGEMVHYGSGFVHLADCTPGTRLLPTLPAFSKRAAFIFRLPRRVRALVEKSTGRVQEVREIDDKGNDTGKILGYFFLPPAKKEGT